MARVCALLVVLLALTPLGAVAATARLYVTDRQTGEVTVIDAVTHAPIGAVQVAGEPGKPVLNPDETRLYVGCWGDNRVYEIDTTTLTVLRTFPLDRNPVSVAITDDGQKLYVVNRRDNSLSRVSLLSGAVDTIYTETVSAIWSVTTGPGNRAYVASYGSVRVFDTTTDAQLPSLPGPSGVGDLAVSPSGDRLYVADGNSGYLLVLDLTTGSVLANIQGASQNGDGLAVSADGRRAYMTHANTGGGVSVFDTATLSRLERYASIGIYPAAVAIDDAGECLFVRSQGLLVTLRASDGNVFNSLPLTFNGSLALGSGNAACGQQTTPDVTWSPSPLTYGQGLTVDQFNATASVPGRFDYEPALGTILSAGTHDLRAVFTPEDETAYLSVETTRSVVVEKASPILSWSSPAPILLGTALTATQLAASANVSGAFTYDPGLGAILPRGTQTLSATFASSDPNFLGGATSTTISVNAGVCILYDASRPVRSGSTLPLKIRLCDANGQNASSDAITVRAVSLSRVSTAVAGDLQDAGQANPDSNFRYAPDLQGYIFNLQTKGLSTGAYALGISISGQSATETLFFQVK